MNGKDGVAGEEVPESEPEDFREDDGVRDGDSDEESEDPAPASRRARFEAKCAYEVYHARPRGAILTAWQRTEWAEDLAFRAAALLAETGGDTPRQAWKAWRAVVEAWLLESGEVVEKTNNVLPHSFGRLGS